jgi:hypothetical protein
MVSSNFTFIATSHMGWYQVILHSSLNVKLKTLTNRITACLIPLKTGCELNNFFKLKFTLAWINYRYKFDLFWWVTHTFSGIYLINLIKIRSLLYRFYHPVFNGIGCSIFSFLCSVCRSLFDIFFFLFFCFFLRLYFRSFLDLRLLITHLISSNFS